MRQLVTLTMKTKNDSSYNQVPVNKINSEIEQNSNVKTKKSTNKCDLGADFVAPDGGWGWLVVIAAGCSNVCYKYKLYNSKNEIKSCDLAFIKLIRIELDIVSRVSYIIFYET